METTTPDLLQRPQILVNSASPFTPNPINSTFSLLETPGNNNYKTELTEEEKHYLSKIPRGYRFCPYDVELIEDYLRNKVENRPLPYSPINDVNIYQFSPEILADKFAKFGEDGDYYFFTPRDKKYRNGSRPNRTAADGYWKATGADKEIKSNNMVIGQKKALVFYQGKPTSSKKTSWLMHEYCLANPPQVTKTNEDDMKLDDWVLCRIYKTPERIVNQKRKRVEENTYTSPSVDQNNEGLMGVIQISAPNVDQNNESLIGTIQISTPSVDKNNKELMGTIQISTPNIHQNNEEFIGMNTTPSVENYNKELGMKTSTGMTMLTLDEMGMIQIRTSNIDQNNEEQMGLITTPSVENYNEELGMMETSKNMRMLMGDENQFLYADSDQHIDEEPLYTYQQFLSNPTSSDPTLFQNFDQQFINNVLNINVFRAEQPLNQYNILLPCSCGQNQCTHQRHYYIR